MCINIKEKAQWIILPENGYARLEESLSVGNTATGLYHLEDIREDGIL